MSLEDYIINSILIGMVFHQIIGKKITVFGMLWPLALVTYVAVEYIHTIPTAGNDLPFVVGATILGLLFGSLSGTLTRVSKRKDGALIGKATIVAAAFWVLGTGARMAFGIFATNGGGLTIARFSIQNHLTAASVWTAALLLMALAEVLGRTVALTVKVSLHQRVDRLQLVADVA